MNNVSENPRTAELLWLIVWIGFFLRALLALLAYVSTQQETIFLAPDTLPYINLAKALFAGKGFAVDGVPEIVRTPGFPVFLLPGVAVGHVKSTTILLQVLANTLTIYLIYRISLRIFKSVEIALLSALLYSIEPLSILFSCMLLTETVFVAILVCAVFFLIHYLDSRSRVTLSVSAALFAGATYVRPISYFLPIVLTVVLLVWLAAKQPRKRAVFADICIFFAIAMGLLGLWHVRNGAVSGYTGFSAIADKNLYFYKGASVLAAAQGVSYYDMQRQMGYMDEQAYAARHPDQNTWSDSRRFSYMRREGTRILLDHPVAYARIHLTGMARTLLDPGAVDYLKLFRRYPQSGGLLGVIIDEGLWHTVTRLPKERPGVFWTSLLLGALLILYLALAGAAILARRGFANNTQVVIILCVVVYFLVLSGGPNSLGRFRHPLMPFISLLAAYGLSTAIHHRIKPIFFSRRK